MSGENQPTIKSLFATPLVETMLPNATALNEALRLLILQQQSIDPGLKRSNFLGWHSKDDMLQWGGEPAKTVAIAALETCSAYTNDIGMRGDTPRFAWNVQMWANVSPKGASNQYHAHPGAFWSAVYYVDDGGDANGGPLVLLDPRFPMNRMGQPDLRIQHPDFGDDASEVSITPTPGKLVAFPSWLSHGVRPHNGEGQRISIAINILAVPVMG